MALSRKFESLEHPVSATFPITATNFLDYTISGEFLKVS